MLLHIGLDDTDSPRGGCTTYIAALLVERLRGLGARFVDYPNLVRLNPNVPWKTRGNGAICLRIDCAPGSQGEIKKAVEETVEEHAEFDCENTNPGIVFHTGGVPEELNGFARRVVQGVVDLEEAARLIDMHCASAVGYKNLRGIIGALAAVGERLEGDHTYEFLAYRSPGDRGKRRLDEASVFEMDRATRGETFSNCDPETGRVLIDPHGLDPVLFGVRGETAEAVHRAGLMVRTETDVERWVIFRTNQGTDAHLKGSTDLANVEPYNPAIAVGDVDARPRTIRGGHVIFPLKDGTGAVDCAAYEPTGPFRGVVRRLIPGDRVRVHGGVRAPEGRGRVTLNLEKMEVLHLAPDIRTSNPSCPECGGGMESMGRDSGYRCRRCGFRDRELTKRVHRVERELKPGLYLPPPRAHRHLTKPLERYGREKSRHVPGALFEPWHWP